MNKSLFIVVGIIAVAVAGYIAHMLYYTSDATGKNSKVIINGNEIRLPGLPTTSDGKEDALSGLAPSSDTAAGVAGDNTKKQLLNDTAGTPNNDLVNLDDAEKLKLLELLKR
jgi:hypothetical protein